MFSQVKSPKLSDAIVYQIEDLILAGVLKPGDPLPPERELARQLDVSRSSLRDAIVKLEARGLLQIRPGTGTRICDILAPTVTEPLVHLLKDQPAAMLDLLELRQALEEIAVFYAAERATDLDLEILRRRFEVLNGAAADTDSGFESVAIAEYYLAMADASHNVALMHVIRGLFNLMRTSIGGALEIIFAQPGAYAYVHDYRRRMHEHVLRGEPEAARSASHALIIFVNQTLQSSTPPQQPTEPGDSTTLFTPISAQDLKPSRLSDAVVAQLEHSIVRGLLKPGSRLPPEHELTDLFRVSRAVLRDALIKLESRALLHSRRGDGIYVCDVPGPTIIDPLVHLLESHPEAVFDFLELRRSLEELSASLAAQRATDDDVSNLQDMLDTIEQACDDPDPHQDAESVASFHFALAESSHNIALVYVMRGLFNLLHKSIRENLHRLNVEPESYELVREHHRAIFDAIVRKNPEQARQAAHVHINFVNRSLREMGLHQRRREQAERRYRSTVEKLDS